MNYSRRDFLRTSASSAGVVVGAALLAACGGGTAASSPSAASPSSAPASKPASASAAAKTSSSPSSAGASSNAAPASSSVAAQSTSAAPSASTAAASPATKARGTIGQAGAKLEKTSIKVGLPVDAPDFVPMYLAADGLFKQEGLDGTVVAFRGDAQVSQALAGGTVDVSLASPDGLINMIKAGQPVMGFYAGYYQALFVWAAQPDIKTWADMKGKTAGVSTLGSQTDTYTRYVLLKHKLQPEKDVNIIQAGGSSTAFQALKAGRLGMAILGSPFNQQAKDAGFTILGTEVSEMNPKWFAHLFISKESFLDQYPNTARALMRVNVQGIRKAKSDKAATVKSLMDHIKLKQGDAEVAYNAAVPALDEHGQIPEQSMPVFWDIEKLAGNVTEPWPESKFMDKRYIDTFAQWAPK